MDIPTLLMPWLIFPFTAKLLRENQHIKVDAIHALLGKQNKIRLELFSLLLSVAICFGLCLIGIKGVQFFALIGQKTYTEIAVPIWYFQLAFPIGFALAVNFAIEGIIEHIFSLCRKTPIDKKV
jgi:TRAP-type C4-dicarboxylate transport system permease small subunit